MWCCKKKLIGIALASMGTGMLVVILIPWWGFILATIMVAIGVFLIIS